MADYQVAVIGAGLSGMSAAAAAAAAGRRTFLIDERQNPGGSVKGRLGANYSDRSPWQTPPVLDDPAAAQLAAEVEQQLQSAAVDIESDALVWGLFKEGELFRIAFVRDGATHSVTAGAVVVATGHYAVGYPFKGFDLPGVVLPSQAYSRLESGAMKAGDRAVLFGQGPVADGLARLAAAKGVEIAARLADPVSSGQTGPKAPAGQEEPADSDSDQALTVKGRLRALGNGRLEGIAFQSAERQEESEIKTDWLLVAAPLASACELAGMAGVEVRWTGYEWGYVPTHDSYYRTSVPGISVCGAAAGLLAAADRAASGRRAAAGIIGPTAGSDHDAEPPMLFPAVPASGTPAGSFYDGLLQEDPAYPICPCAEHDLGELVTAIEDGCRELGDVKRISHVGMGPCQSRICQRSQICALHELAGVAPAALGPMRVRPPVRPVPARQLVEGSG